MCKTLLLSASFLFFTAILFGQGYSYPRIEGILNAKLVLSVNEFRSSETDTFKIVSRQTAEFTTNCLQTKFRLAGFGNSNNTEQEIYRDSIVYVNSKPKNVYHFTQNPQNLAYKITFISTADGKIDTSYFQYYTSGILGDMKERGILYRNRFGYDSIYKKQVLLNSVWKLNGDYYDYVYDNSGRLTQGKTTRHSGDSIIVSVVTSIYNISYTGNNPILRVDSSTTLPTDIVFTSFRKTELIFNNLGQLATQTFSFWNAPNPPPTFNPQSRLRSIAYNAKSRITELILDYWINGAWVETGRFNTTYVNDTVPKTALTYNKNGSNWWLSGRNMTQYCGIINAVQDVNPLALKIFPNPANSSVTLEAVTESSSKNTVSIFNNTGHKVFEKRAVTLPYSCDVSNYADGLYFIHVNTEGGQTVTQKLVILK